MQFSIVFVTVLFAVSEGFMIKPQGVVEGTGNSWVYFGRGLNQKEITDIAASKSDSEEKIEPTAAPVETTPEVKVESTVAPATAEIIANVKSVITTAAPEVAPLEEVTSTTLPETTVDNIRGLPETVLETTENPQPEVTSESVQPSTAAPVEESTPEILNKEIKEVETTASPTEIPIKVKIIVIPKESTNEPSTTAPENNSTQPEPVITGAASKEETKPEDSSSSSEEINYMKPDLHSMFKRIYKGKGPLHHT